MNFSTWLRMVSIPCRLTKQSDNRCFAAAIMHTLTHHWTSLPPKTKRGKRKQHGVSDTDFPVALVLSYATQVRPGQVLPTRSYHPNAIDLPPTTTLACTQNFQKFAPRLANFCRNSKFPKISLGAHRKREYN
uniref:(northern house mosquito) hypothetical protein n=1 Tax=Culex pipiens TaxID=7175 RepID=A0A8D8BHI7_CULPI